MHTAHIPILAGATLQSFENSSCEEKDNMNIARLCCYGNCDFSISSLSCT